MFLTPRYGERSLAELTPALAAALGVPGMRDALGLPECRRACLFFIDGLGYDALLEHKRSAPFLAGAAAKRDPLTTPFPSTTATSTTTLGVGVPPGIHGIVGYTMAIEGYEQPMNTITWRLEGGDGRDLRSEVVPEDLQPTPTVYERMARGGVPVTVIAPPPVRGSGLTRAALRPADVVRGFALSDIVGETVAALGSGTRYVHTYVGELDTIGHLRGGASSAWALEVELLDRAAREIAKALHPDGLLVVTGDHGMTDVPPDRRLPLADDRDLRQGVRMVAGEARARHIYFHTGEAERGIERWRDRLAGHALVVSRDDAISAGWFGPEVRAEVRGRIGDAVAVSFDGVGVFAPVTDPDEASLVGHHGSLTSSDCLVPLVVIEC